MGVKYEARECPRCGRLFTCTGDSNCWCLNVEMSESVSDYLSCCYEGCVCLHCVNELEEELKNKSCP